MPRCCIVTAYRRSEYAALANLTLPRMQALAARHGHDLRVHRLEDTDLDRAWMKIPPILDALDSDYEFVVWLDIDALILRLDRDILDAARPGIDLLMSWHEPAPFLCPEDRIPAHYNAGVYLIRRSDWSRDFFARMLTKRGQLNHPWSDQAALHVMLGLNESLGLGPDLPGVPDRSSVGHLDTAWNSIPGVAMADDPIIHHFAGLPHDARLRLMESNVAILEIYETAPARLRSALSHQLCLWAAAERRAIDNDHHRQTLLLLQEAELARLRTPRQMLRDFPKVLIKRLKEKVRGNQTDL
ncbi:MAG: hypothetical protein V4602_09235 [Pseudomonadota bacterium]